MIENILSDKPEMKNTTDGEQVTEWVLNKANEWRNHRQSNYDPRWELFDSVWRGQSRKTGTFSETFIAPATAQAVESSVAEIEETVFGRGAPFDIRDDDNQPEDVASTKAQLWNDMQKTKNGVRKAVSESLINAAVYGTGITELQVVVEDRKVPTQVPTNAGPLVSANTNKYVCVKWRAINPTNFLIDPNATCIEDALGVCIEEYVGKHTVYEAMNKGWYKYTELYSNTSSDLTLEKDKKLTNASNPDRVKILKYYGMVPRHMLTKFKNSGTLYPEYEDILPSPRRKDRMTEEEAENELNKLAVEAPSEDEDDMVEAIVVIANDCQTLKAEETPYIMEDRPIVAFPWDYVPGRFWGRGVCEKGLNAQMVLDEEIRQRLEALKFTSKPMVGLDSTKLPRGFKFEVKSGKNLLFIGKPSDVMEQFKIGELDPNTWRNTAEMERMVFQSTGAADLSGIPGEVNGEASAAGMSMALSGVIKRTKRVILNFYDQYFMPGVQKTAWRYMQFAPEQYQAQDYEFIPSSTMGIMAREYEQTQLVSLLQNMQPGTPTHTALLLGVVENSSLHGRENVLNIIKQSTQPDPKAQQQQEQAQQLEQAAIVATIKDKEASAQQKQAAAFKAAVEARLAPEELRAKIITALTRNSETETEFEKRVEVAKLALQEKDIVSNERIAAMQMAGNAHSKKIDAMLEAFKSVNDGREQEFVYDEQGNITGARNKAK